MNVERSHFIIGGIVLVAHVLVLSLARVAQRAPEDVARPAEPVSAQLIVQSETWDRVPAPQLRLEAPPRIETSLREIQFVDSVEAELAAISGPASAPRLMRYQTADISNYARRAHLLQGHPVTVILLVNVLEDGRAGSVDVSRSSGNAEIDSAAVDYALELQWVPATRERVPVATRIALPVTLSVSS
jgi:TonB family protein